MAERDWNLLPLKRDYSIFKKFNFEREPVAVNYCFYKPDWAKKLDKPAGLCEMPKVCNDKKEAFYITAAEEDCVGKKFLNLPIEVQHMRFPDGGRLGVNLGVFQRPVNNLRIREFCPNMPPGTVNYVLFTPMSQMTKEPDLLYFVCPATQADLLLRANTYMTGEPYEAIGTSVANCCSLFIYPFQKGKINYMVSGLSWGMNGRKVYPEGLVVVVIPFNKIQAVIDGLESMTWYRDSLNLTRDEYQQWDHELTQKTQKESQNPHEK